MNKIHTTIQDILKENGIIGSLQFSAPPSPDMGDIALGCFPLAKEMGKKPAEIAKEIAEKIDVEKYDSLEKVEAAGPYVNFSLNGQWLAETMFSEIKKDYGSHKLGKGKTQMIEFAHPNTHKMFHIGHLRNITTGESIVRILENIGYKIVRANYQGDVGMHIAKSLWGINQFLDEYEETKNKSLHERVEFLGKAYALGGQSYEDKEEVKNEIIEINKKIYSRDKSIQEIYKTTRDWSLEYFDHIYNRVYSHFDRSYFESEVYERGEEIVREFLKKNVFEESQGAIIFPGEKQGLHNRVFITSRGFAGYEAKDLALAELQFSKYNPEKIIHVVGKEQAGYFEVLFKALEFTLPESKGKEEHLDYGWVHLKNGKMSSRTGKVVLGEWLIDEIKLKILKVMEKSEVKDKEDVAEKLAIAAVKYSFLKTGVKNDMAFDINESINVQGDSGPYLLYITARIKSIFRKAGAPDSRFQIPDSFHATEKALLLHLSYYPEVTAQSAQELDPSKIAHYLFALAQAFNSFYHGCPVMQAEGEVKDFRLHLIKNVLQVMEHGLNLLGIQSVEEM